MNPLNDIHYFLNFFRVDGGVSKNDFICQLIADLTQLNVERAKDSELSALGAGFLAGLNLNVWKSRDELLRLREIDKVFTPNENNFKTVLEKMKCWERAVDRFKGWYSS